MIILLNTIGVDRVHPYSYFSSVSSNQSKWFSNELHWIQFSTVIFCVSNTISIDWLNFKLNHTLPQVKTHCKVCLQTTCSHVKSWFQAKFAVYLWFSLANPIQDKGDVQLEPEMGHSSPIYALSTCSIRSDLPFLTVQRGTPAITLPNAWHALETYALFSNIQLLPLLQQLYICCHWAKIVLIWISIALFANLTPLPSSQDGRSV